MAAHKALHRGSSSHEHCCAFPRPDLSKFLLSGCKRQTATRGCCAWEEAGAERRRRALAILPGAPAAPHESLCFTRRRRPSLLEYLSYNCNFMGVLAGPLCSYKDYITFIEGRSYHAATPPGDNGREDRHDGRTEPSPNVRPRAPAARAHLPLRLFSDGR